MLLHLRSLPTINYAPEGTGGTGDGGDGQGAGGKGAGGDGQGASGKSGVMANEGDANKTARTMANADGNAKLEADGRPVGLPEKFWDAKTKAVRQDDLIKSYTQIEGLVTRRADQMNTDDFTRLVDTRVQGMTKEIRDSALKDWRGEAPKAPTDYKLAFSNDVLGKFPAHMRDMAALEGDPLVGWWRGYAHKSGLGQPQFEAGIADYIQTFTAAEGARIQSEVSKLGENGKVRIEALGSWFDANLPAEHAAALKSLTSNANAVAALETLKALTGDQSVTSGAGSHVQMGSVGVPLSTEAEIKQAMKDPRYFDQLKRDKSFVAAIENAWGRLYPEK